MSVELSKLRTIAFGAATLLAAVPMDATAQTKKFHLGCDDAGCAPDTRTAENIPHPYFYLNRRITDASVNGSIVEALSYRVAFHRFPNVVSCLKRDAKTDHGYDLTIVNWPALSSDAKAKLCIARIHAVIGDADLSLAWFERLGFDARLQRYPSGHHMAGYTKLFASTHNSPFGWSENWPRKLLALGGPNIGMTFSPVGKLGSVTLNYTIE